MKLIDLLVKELPKIDGWPEGACFAAQDYNGDVFFYSDSPKLLKEARVWSGKWEKWMNFEIATDWDTSIITREQYEAALAARVSCVHEWAASEGRTASGYICRKCGDYNGPKSSEKADTDGWIEWRGGECPVPFNTRVDVKLRNGKVHENQQAWEQVSMEENTESNSKAGWAFWKNECMEQDIIAYRHCTEIEQTTFKLENFTYFSNVREAQTHINVEICQNDVFIEDNINLLTCFKDEKLGGVRFTPEQALQFALDLAATAAKMMNKE